MCTFIAPRRCCRLFLSQHIALHRLPPHHHNRRLSLPMRPGQGSHSNSEWTERFIFPVVFECILCCFSSFLESIFNAATRLPSSSSSNNYTAAGYYWFLLSFARLCSETGQFRPASIIAHNVHVNAYGQWGCCAPAGQNVPSRILVMRVSEQFQ